MSKIMVQDLHKSFGDNDVLKGIDLTVAQGEVVAVIGPSGSGKSTLLRCLNKLEEPTAGHVVIDGVDLTDKSVKLDDVRQRIGMVFQHFNLFPHMTVLGNLMEAPVGVRRQPRAEVRGRALALLDQVGLADKKDAYPRNLSGGQQQRVAIARALCMQPDLMLFDEPTSALDPELVGGVLSAMLDLAQSGMTMIVVTHEIAFARDVADRVAFFDGGQIVECGPAEQVINAPRHERTQQFLAAVR